MVRSGGVGSVETMERTIGMIVSIFQSWCGCSILTLSEPLSEPLYEPRGHTSPVVDTTVRRAVSSVRT